VVGTDRSPLIAVGATTGEYTVATLAGPATVSARATGTALRGQGSVTIAGGVGSGFSRTDLDLTLEGAVTTAVVTPIDGSVAVSLSAGEAIAEVAVLLVEPRQVNAELLDGGGQRALDDPRRPRRSRAKPTAMASPRRACRRRRTVVPVEGAVGGDLGEA